MTRKLVTAAIAVVISFALWMYVVMVIGPEYKDNFRNVQVKTVGKLDDDLMIIGNPDYTVDLVLSGNRSDLNKLTSANILVELNLSKIQEPGKTAYRYDVSVPDSITIENRNPAGITLEVVRRKEKIVDVEIVYDESIIPTGYGTLPVEPEFEKIEIAGPEEVIDQIEVARIELAITEENNKSDIVGEYEVRYYDAEGQKVDSAYVSTVEEAAEKINVTLPIRMKKVLPLKIHVIEGGGVTAENVTISPSTITVLGKEEDLKDLEEWYINTEDDPLDLSTLEAGDTIDPFPIELPKTIINKSNMEEATVTVSFDNVIQKDFIIKQEQIQLYNVPAGMIPEISEQQIKVTVRGMESAVSRLDTTDILVSVDFADAKLGSTKEWTVKITISGDPANMGVVGGPYTVYVEMKDASQVAALAFAETE